MRVLEFVISAIDAGSAPDPSGLDRLAALLLRATEPLQGDPLVADARDRLAAVVDGGVDRGRLADVLCLEPDHAYELAYSWLHLRDLHYAGPHLDALLEAALPTSDDPGAELLPSQDLERRWLRGVWSGDFSGLDDVAVGRGSALARQVDVLNAGPAELEVFTRCALYACDVGRREPGHAISLAEAEAVLSLALDADDLALTASALWLWPLYALPWRASAGFAMRVLETEFFAHGFLPGPTYDVGQREHLDLAAAEAYALRTSVHATLSFGILSALMWARPVKADADAGDPPVHVPELVASGRRWEATYDDLRPQARDALAPMIVTLAIRRARDEGDVPGVGSALEAALALERTDCLAAQQAGGLLRRAVVRADAGLPMPRSAT